MTTTVQTTINRDEKATVNTTSGGGRPRAGRLPPTGWDRLLVAIGGAGLTLGLVTTISWALTGGYFWPRWIWFGWGVLFGLAFAVSRGLRTEPGRKQAFALNWRLAIVLGAMEIVIWLLTAQGLFWPIWPLIILAAEVGIHAIVIRRMPPNRERELADRVDVLTRTRRGVVDVQAAELKRIERDLHDGAQARMVSLAMNLGLAEELAKTDPSAAADLMAEARHSSLAALDELRTVMRGIQPPVLSDRGLVGAVEALALDLSIPTTVIATLPGRPATPVESAVYLAVAECLANVVKHSRATSAWVVLRYREGVLSVVVGDDGTGGADPQRGTGLVGVARRLAVFDGTIRVHSPAGGPTEVIMELPCELSSPKTSSSSGTD